MAAKWRAQHPSSFCSSINQDLRKGENRNLPRSKKYFPKKFFLEIISFRLNDIMSKRDFLKIYFYLLKMDSSDNITDKAPAALYIAAK